MSSKFPTLPHKNVKKPEPPPSNIVALKQKIRSLLAEIKRHDTIEADNRDEQNYENGMHDAYTKVLKMM